MQSKSHLAPDQIRSDFSSALSAMYRKEVPAYGTLMSLVAKVNDEMLEADPDLRESLAAAGSLDRLADERHGAIRLGWPSELFTIRRIFAVMGMFPVGYYDLSAAGVPVHSTAFRPTDPDSLARNPFRVFTSLLRLDLHSDTNLRDEAAEVLAKRRIFTDGALELLEKAERDGGLTHLDASGFVKEILETFRWQEQATVSKDMYERLHAAHRLVADVVSFKGPHINHLTPRTLDIDEVQRRMPDEGISPKAVIEGPPRRACPILLRQTSFKALEEQIAFGADDGEWKTGTHRARFGEIEQRGAALTPKGRALYDKLLAVARSRVRPAPDGSNATDYVASLQDAFAAFPDTWAELRAEGLCYFSYHLTQLAVLTPVVCTDIEEAIDRHLVRFEPLIYEDFLPVSAAGIFQSNLGNDDARTLDATPSRQLFEDQLGCAVLDEFEHYALAEARSIDACLTALCQSAAE